MKITHYIVLTLGALLLSACTFMYQRQYVAEPEEQLTLAEQRAVFEAFKTFLVAKGLSPLPTRNGSSPNVIAFKIGGGSAGALFKTPYSDILELKYVEGQNFELRLVRIISHPNDFSELGLATFVSESESFIRQASARRVRLRLVTKTAA